MQARQCPSDRQWPSLAARHADGGCERCRLAWPSDDAAIVLRRIGAVAPGRNTGGTARQPVWRPRLPSRFSARRLHGSVGDNAAEPPPTGVPLRTVHWPVSSVLFWYNRKQIRTVHPRKEVGLFYRRIVGFYLNGTARNRCASDLERFADFRVRSIRSGCSWLIGGRGQTYVGYQKQKKNIERRRRWSATGSSKLVQRLDFSPLKKYIAN